MKILFWISAFIIFWIYLGYPFVLFILAKIKREEKKIIQREYYPEVSIIIAAYNEEKNIENRIKNCLELNYPKDKIEIIIGSDGSTDKTVEIASKYKDRGVKILDFKQNRGRAIVHNDCVKNALADILFFTDAETVFDKNFLKNSVGYFCDEKVGSVVGKLLYRTSGSSISESEGLYLKYELKIKEWESSLGIMAFGIGACMGLRKKIFKQLRPIDDVDFTSVQDAIIQGYKVIFEPKAIAYDRPPSSVKAEFKSRIRITAKNLIGTLQKWGIVNWFKHPFISWGILSHRILRWLGPYFMLLALISNIFLLKAGHFYVATFAFQIVFYLLALIGAIQQKFKFNIRLANTIFSFCVANAGMFVGVLKGVFGLAPAFYHQHH